MEVCGGHVWPSNGLRDRCLVSPSVNIGYKLDIAHSIQRQKLSKWLKFLFLVEFPFNHISSTSTRCFVKCSTKQVWLLKWVLDYPNPDYPYLDIWTSAHVAMFSAPAGKRCCGHWSFARGESKAAVRMTFPNATTLFLNSIGFRSRFTTSELAERSHEHSNTLYYSVAN